MVIKTTSAQATIELGKLIGKNLKKGMVITLKGDLGAGKTTFTKGIGLGLDIIKPINSPTFTIMKIYEGSLPLYHIDAYRLEGAHQDLGFEEYIEGDGVCVIEWAEFISELIPDEYLSIDLKYIDEFNRQATLIAKGVEYKKILEVI